MQKRGFTGFLLAGLALALAVQSVQAQPTQTQLACYNPAEVEAEQGLRLHSQMLAASLACGQAANDGGALYRQYHAFTKSQSTLLRGWERTMIGHFRRQGTADPTAGFDALRTGLANEASQRISVVTVPIYCAAHLGDLRQAFTLSPAAFRQQAVNSPMVLTRQRRCD